MPVPGEKETQQDFHARCEAYPDMQKYEGKQRTAICYSKWAAAHPQSAEAKREEISVQRESGEPLTVSADGEVSGYACTWEFNRDGIQFVKGSFAKTLAERAGKIPITVRHTITGSSVLETVGWVLRGIEDEVGLLVTCQFLNTPMAQEMRRRAKIGAIRGMSIFAPIINYNLVNGIRRATEAMLMDVTLTNTPLDANATLLAARAEPEVPVAPVAPTPPQPEPPAPAKVADTPEAAMSRARLIEVHTRKVEFNARSRTTQ